jgi:hypothetical protein
MRTPVAWRRAHGITSRREDGADAELARADLGIGHLSDLDPLGLGEHDGRRLHRALLSSKP